MIAVYKATAVFPRCSIRSADGKFAIRLELARLFNLFTGIGEEGGGDPMTEAHEAARLDALHRLDLLDSPPSETFDRITRMASQIFDLPVAAVSLTDRDRQWFKSRVGVDHWFLPREGAPCAKVAESAGPLVIPDLLADKGYAASTLARQGIRFYAGAPLVTRDGFGLGALCVLGTEPREPSTSQMAALGDLAQMVMSQIELQHAFGRIDPTSGLPNRIQFLDDLEDLGRESPGEERLLVLIDLARGDQLTNGVRVLGSVFLDQMIGNAARTLRAALGPGRKAYHVAATQFAFIGLPDPETTEQVASLAELLEHARVENNFPFGMTTAVGLAPFVTGSGAPADVLRMAHNAACDARSQQVSVTSYSRWNDERHQRRFRLLNDFGAAFQSTGQLRVVVQPRIDLRSGACVGAEALLRWTHPEFGEVPAAEFIPIIEQTSLARPMTRWVLRAALQQLAAWQAADLDLDLSINISAANLEESDFAAQVQLALRDHGVPPYRLELEVTESAVMANAQRALRHLQILDDAGIRVAIDDFGTGHSSLAYLQRLPARVVKIDQSFVRRLPTEERARTLVCSMVSLSHDLGYRVVAEGVDTADALHLLGATGCDEAQGHYLARPMELDAFQRWLGSSPFARQPRIAAA